MGPTFRTALPARYRRPALWAALVCSPTLVLFGSMGVASAVSPAVYEPVGVNAGDTEWLDTLTAPQAQGQGGTVVPLAPTSPVLPSGGDLQVLTITEGGPADDVATVPATVPVGDVTPTFRLSRSGIPVRVLRSYVAAAQMMARTDPGCHIHWSLVAGIGRVESNHGRFGGSSVTAAGRVVPPILGPRLDGSRTGWAVIRDSDRGVYDGDRAYDRAVGPMQFLPGTWKHFGADGDGDRRADPQDVDDAALGTARYLCAGGKDLRRRTDRWNAILRYNHSSSYAALVLGLADTYASGRAVPVPAPPAGVKPPKGETGSPERPPGPVTPAPVTSSPSPTPAPTPSTSPSPLPTSTLPGRRPPVRPGTPTPGVPTSPTGTTAPDPTPSTGTVDPGGVATTTPAPDPTTAQPDPTTAGPIATPEPTPTPEPPAPQDTAPPPDPTPPADPPPADPPASDPPPADPPVSAAAATSTP